MSKNPIAKFMNRFNKPKSIPNKKQLDDYYHELALSIKESSQERVNYPAWVCHECGIEASGGKCFSVSTYHDDICDVCGEYKSCTEPRDFYYPRFKGFN